MFDQNRLERNIVMISTPVAALDGSLPFVAPTEQPAKRELLGAWPVLSEADILFLEGGEHLTDMDFRVSRDEDLGFAGLRLRGR